MRLKANLWLKLKEIWKTKFSDFPGTFSRRLYFPGFDRTLLPTKFTAKNKISISKYYRIGNSDRGESKRFITQIGGHDIGITGHRTIKTLFVPVFLVKK